MTLSQDAEFYLAFRIPKLIYHTLHMQRKHSRILTRFRLHLHQNHL